MDLVIDPAGGVRAVYSEEIDLAVIGPLRITRASNVEPTPEGRWLADLSPVGGGVLGPFDRRSQAIDAETTWLGRHWLAPGT